MRGTVLIVLRLDEALCQPELLAPAGPQVGRYGITEPGTIALSLGHIINWSCKDIL